MLKGFWRWYDRASRLDFAGTLIGFFFDWKSWLLAAGGGAISFFWAAIDDRSPLIVWVIAVIVTAGLAVLIHFGILIGVQLNQMSDSDAETRVTSIAENDEGPLKIQFGEHGSFSDVPEYGLYKFTKRLKVELRNADRARTLYNCKIQITDIQPNNGFRTPRILADNVTLAAGDQLYVPLIKYGQAREAHISNYADSFMEICLSENPPLLPIEIESLITLRATAQDAPFTEVQCRVWVDTGGRLRIQNAIEPRNAKTISLLEAAMQAYEQTFNTTAGRAARGFQNTNEQILTYYCYALTTNSRNEPNPPLLQVFGSCPPARTIMTIPVDGPVMNYRFVEGHLVLENRANGLTYDDLCVLEKELPAAIAEIAKW